MMEPQYMRPGESMPQYMRPGESMPQYIRPRESMPQYMRPGESMPQYMRPGESMPQYMRPGESMPQYMRPGESMQHTLEWYRARLGNFTGSRVGELMGKGKKAGETFSKTALSYIYEVASERDMSERIVNDDALFTEWLEATNIETKAMRMGTELEPVARMAYAKRLGLTVEEVGSFNADNLDHFSSSPDGWIREGNGCLEIKCPSQGTFMQYRAEIHDNDTLKAVKPQYYWQCQSHMLVTGCEWCDFVVFSPYQRKGHTLHIVRVESSEADQLVICERVRLANEEVAFQLCSTY